MSRLRDEVTARRRAPFASMVAAAVVAAAGCGGSQVAFPEDERVSNARYYEEPQVYRTALLGDPWLRQVKVGNSTFGREIPRIVRIDVDGIGPLKDRDITLQTPPTVQLFSGPREQRMKRFMHGALSLLDEHGGHVRGFAIASSRATFEAAAISPIIERNYIDGELSAAERRLLSRLLSGYGQHAARHTLAWYDVRSSWITIGATLGRTIRTFAEDPSKVTPAEGIFTAYVLRHEFEHAVTTPDFEQNEHVSWVEEGAADALAKWPGAAAQTAKALGLPYPEKYERVGYSTRRGGYPEWSDTIVLLLRAAGLDHASPEALSEASELLQSSEPRHVPGVLADAIALEQGLSPARRARLRREITRLGGSEARTRRLVRGWL